MRKIVEDNFKEKSKLFESTSSSIPMEIFQISGNDIKAEVNDDLIRGEVVREVLQQKENQPKTLE